MSFITHLTCSRCHARHDAGVVQTVCRSCGGPLLVEYDLDRVDDVATPDDFRSRASTMWRYRELLPLPADESPPTLGEGFTPLLPAPELGSAVGLPDLLVKEEGVNPTGTFKARGAACGIAMARSLGIGTIGLPTAGNAGGAWACYGAAAGIEIHVAMPEDAPSVNVEECRMFGAEVTLVEGSIADAGKVIGERSHEQGWFNAATLHEPYRIEGKKTLGLEIAEQLGWRAPDWIVYPAGGGVGLIGIHRAFTQLQALGWVDEIPRLAIVQSEGCAPLIKAFEEKRLTADPWPDPQTIAQGLRVPAPFGDALVLEAVRATGGAAVAVSDLTILDAMETFARRSGILAGPEGAATLAAARVLREQGTLQQNERVVLVNTGSALKAPEVLAHWGPTP